MKVLKESIGTVLDIDSLLDILNGETLSDVGSALANGTRNKEGYSSIASRANELTATFPILISNRVSLKTAEKIQKALEFRYALMLQMVIASRSFTTSKDAVDFLKNYHTNIDAGSWRSIGAKILSTTDEAAVFEMSARKAINESYAQNSILNENAKPVNLQAFQEAKGRVFPNYKSLSYKVGFQQGVKAALRGAKKNAFVPIDPYKKARLDATTNRIKQRQEIDAAQKKEDIKTKAEAEREKLRHENEEKKQKGRVDAEREIEEIRNKGRRDIELMTPLSVPTLNDQKVRKANMLNPLTMSVFFKVKASEDAVVTVNALIGVKAKLYPVDSMEIMDRIYSSRRTKINLFNFIRAFSGEIQFWRDFIFTLGKAKIDANFNAKRVGSKLWKVLERRSKTSRISQMLNINNAATAITTLVLSMEEVEFLNKEADIDLLDSHEARKILDDFNFISIMIVDENLETIRTIMDTGNDEWESSTFKAFDRDEEMDYKQMVKMLAKAY